MDQNLPLDGQPIADQAANAANPPVSQDAAGAAPPQAGAPDAQPQTAEQLAQVQAQLDQERQRREQAERQIAGHQRQVAADAARQWQTAEADLHAWLPTADPDDAVRATTEFYKQREAFILNQHQQSQQQIYQERVHAFADHIIKEKGLQSSDAARLLAVAATDPNQMVAQADAILAERNGSNSRVAELERKIEQLQRGQQAAAIGQSGVWNGGGANSNGAPVNVSHGTEVGFRNALAGFGGIQR